jgi:hypothetical protein
MCRLLKAGFGARAIWGEAARSGAARESITMNPYPPVIEIHGDDVTARWCTLGVPLLQEQATRVAIVAAGFTPGEADDFVGGWAPVAAPTQPSRGQRSLDLTILALRRH